MFLRVAVVFVVLLVLVKGRVGARSWSLIFMFGVPYLEGVGCIVGGKWWRVVTVVVGS